MNTLRKIGATVLSASVLSLSAAPAHAGIVSPSEAFSSEKSSSRADIYAFFDRADVQAELVELGVDPSLAKTRVNSMTEAEVANLRSRIADEPAGAGALGVLFSIFVILLVTDILGLTKVFPFTRSVR